MIWQVWADIFVGAAIPLATLFLYYKGVIRRTHLWLMVWGFVVGSTWEFAFFFLGDSVHTMKTEWPMHIITLHLSHTFWDAGLFIIGYWICLAVFKTADCCKTFQWKEMVVMWLWGIGQAFVIEILGNGVIWEYRVLSWNPVWITIGGQGYTILPMVIWGIAPIIYYLGFIMINRHGD